MSIKTSRPVVAVALGALLAGCETEQEAQPLSLTVPVAVLLLIALPVCWTVAHLLIRHLGHELSRRLLEPSPALPLRWPVATAVAAAAPVVVPAAFLWPAGCWFVATEYQQPIYDLFSWKDTVTIYAFFGAVIVLLGVTATLVASALRSGTRRGVLAARWVLGLLIAATILIGIGVLWIPALALSFVTAAVPAGSTYGPMPSR